jgi:hypothetical protein
MRILSQILTTQGSAREANVRTLYSQISQFSECIVHNNPPGDLLDYSDLVFKDYIRLFPRHDISELLFSSSSLRYYPGTLGCAVAHAQACHTLLTSNFNYSIILEDNVILCDGFKEGIHDLFESLKGCAFDIVHLYSSRGHPRILFRDNIYYGKEEWGTTKAHVISRRYAEYVIASLPLASPSDGLSCVPSKTWLNTGLSSFTTLPYLVSVKDPIHSDRLAKDTRIRSEPYGSFSFKNMGDCGDEFYLASRETGDPITSSINFVNSAIRIRFYAYIIEGQTASLPMRLHQLRQSFPESIDKLAALECLSDPSSLFLSCDYVKIPVAMAAFKYIYIGPANIIALKDCKIAIYPHDHIIPCLAIQSSPHAFQKYA